MPAAKDHVMLHGHWTKGQIEEKKKSKASVTPRVKLKVPKRIRDNVNFYAIWKRTIKLYDGTELLNALDTDLLADYCEETYALEQMKNHRYDDSVMEDPAFMLKVETRIEAKTKMLNQMRLSLYLTPRARAGAVPNQPDKEAKEDDPNAEMFD